MQVHYFRLVFVEQHIEWFLKEIDPLKEETNVQLFLDLLSALVDGLHAFPIRSYAQSIEEQKKNVSDEYKKVEVRKWLVWFNVIEMWACIEFEGVLCVFLHKEQQNHHEAEETADVWQSLIDFLESSLNNNCSARSS